MKEGDMLYFKKPELAQFIAQGVPSFGVNVGTQGSQVAVHPLKNKSSQVNFDQQEDTSCQIQKTQKTQKPQRLKAN
jgi:flagellar motor switch protein FliM